MPKGNRPEDDTAPRARRRRRPPVLELRATEIGAEGVKAEAEQPKAEQAQETPTAASQWRDQLAALDWRGLAVKPLLAGGIGAIAGAAIVLFVLLARERGGDARVSELAGEVANLSARIETLAARPPVGAEPGALGERIDRLTAAIGETEQRLAMIERRPPPQPADLSAVNERTAAIETALKDLRTALADLRRMAERVPPAATSAAVEALAGRIGGLEEQIAKLAVPRPPVPATTLAAELVALNELAGAIQSGKPFTKELEVARARLGERAAPLTALEPFAARGLPTLAALTERFSTLAPQLLRGPDPAGGFFSRLFTNAVRLVEVRPVGEPEGVSLGAVVARIEAKLGRGDLAGALAESDSLPQAEKSAASGWIAAARQRRDAELAVNGLIDAALTNSAGRAQP